METSINPLIEYFYLFGLSAETIKKPEFYKENNFMNQEFLKPEMLSKFPPIKKPNAEIDPNIIISHCYPKSLKVVESASTPNDEFFHFSIDNTPSRHTKNENIYYSCLIFYESLITYYNIQKLINHDNRRISMSNILYNNNELSNEGCINKSKTKKFEVKSNTTMDINKSHLFDKFYIPKVICFASFVPFPNEFKYLLKKIKEYSMGILGKITIPIEKIVENLVISIPRPIRGRFNLKFKKDFFLLNGDKNDFDIILPNFNQYLFHSYRYQLIFIFSVEDIIEIYKSLLLEIPLLFFSNDKEKLTNIVQSFLELLTPFKCQYPHAAILPEDNLGIIYQAKSFVLGINENWKINENGENFFDRKKILIFNKPIRICDIDNQKLDLVYNKKDFESVITFEDLGKINRNKENDNNPETNSDSKNNNNDTNNENTLNEYKGNEYSFELIGYQLPIHYGEKIKKKLNQFLKEKFSYAEYDPNINKKISEEIFYYLLISILQNYNTYLYNTEEKVESINSEIFTKTMYNVPIETLFNVENFLYYNKREDKDFFTAFLNTKIFRNFLERKYMNKEIDKFSFLHFDETILSKQNRNLFSKKLGIEFLENKGLETKTWYIINKNNNPTNFNKNELDILKEKKTSLINYYKIFNEKDYKYYLFPIFLYNNHFFNNEQYKLVNFFTLNNLNLKKCIQETNDILTKVKDPKLLSIYNSEYITQFKHNPSKSVYPKEIENSIYLLWLKVFCMTFYYCDKNEKYLRFYEMIKIVRKLYYVKDNILSLILATLEKYGDEYMIIEFFDYIKNFTYGDYAYLANKLLNKERVKNKNIVLKKMPISNTGIILFYYKDIKEQEFNIPLFSSKENNLDKNIHQRTFFSKDYKINDKFIGQKEVVRFDNPITCNNCGQKIDIAKMTIIFDQMKKYEKMTCYVCKQQIEPKVRVKIYDNFFTISLYEPYFLYSNTATNLMNLYGNELNLDVIREKYNSFLCNCCWYFNIKGISYDMMLKYKDENKENDKIEQNKKKRKARFVSLEIEKTNE